MLSIYFSSWVEHAQHRKQPLICLMYSKGKKQCRCINYTFVYTWFVHATIEYVYPGMTISGLKPMIYTIDTYK